ncbi:MAG: hypothetical protein N2746_12045 [Deltaproteobacteria bacterium]|nr:hypothetical protein [Deltaproteobacteria bacterium]
MKKIFLGFVFLFTLFLISCDDSSATGGDAGLTRDAKSNICKSDNDCDKAAGEKCVSSVCKVPDCLKDQDCINKKLGNKCDLTTYTCKTVSSDGGVDILSDVGGNECTDNCSEKCKPNKICKNGYCIDYGMCQNDNDCPCGWHCNSFESRCEECASDDDCKNRTDGKTKCDIGKTFLCIEPPVCNPACDPNCQVCKDGNCVLAPNKCCQNSDCPSNNCVNYECKESKTCSDVCSTDQECKEWCKDASYICHNNVCMPKGCSTDQECDAQCGAGLGQCIGGSCQCKPGGGSGIMCDPCDSDADCDTANGFTCYEFTNPLNQQKWKACTHGCSQSSDCEDPSFDVPAFICMLGGGGEGRCCANKGTLCSCMQGGIGP